MKTTNKKRGFTIVELVIVIAVIAILAAVLIPTFSGVVQKAKDSAALQEATAAYKETIGMTEYASIATDAKNPDAYINVDGVWFSVEDGVLTKAAAQTFDPVDDVDDVGYVSAAAVLGEDAPANVYVYAKCTKAAVAADPANSIEAADAEFELLGGDI